MTMNRMLKGMTIAAVVVVLGAGQAQAGFGLGMTGAVKNQMDDLDMDDLDKEVAKKKATKIVGTAAAGAPIVGTVTIKDSSIPAKTQFTTIAADGRYEVDVTDLTPPFMLRAEGRIGGRGYEIYSAATAADVNGTINITPLTDLIIANIAGQIADNLWNAAAGFAGTITKTALDTSQTQVRARFIDVLTAVGLDASIDLLRVSFVADHTGLDLALDILDVEVDPATVVATITNRVNGAVITDDLTTVSDVTVLDATGTVTALTDFQAIAQVFQTFSSKFATSLPAEDDPVLLSLFHLSFLDGGQTAPAFLSELTTEPSSLELTFSDVVVLSITATGTSGTAVVTFNVFLKGGRLCYSCGDGKWTMLKNASGNWQFAGDQRKADIRIHALAERDDVGGIVTGLSVYVNDEGGMGIDYAIVTGPGLPMAGNKALLVHDFQTPGGSFYIANTMVYSGTTTGHMNNALAPDHLAMTDAVIALVNAGDIYTFELWDDAGTTGTTADDTMMATYTQVLGVPPVLSAALLAGSFPTILAPTKAVLFSLSLTGGTLSISWSVPAGLDVVGGWVGRNGATGGDGVGFTTTSATQTSVSLTLSVPTFTVIQATVGLVAYDTDGREYRTHRLAP